MSNKIKKNIVTKKFETFLVSFFVLVFLIGFFSGWFFSDKTLSDIDYQLEKTSLNLRSLSQQILFDNVFEVGCDQSRVDLLVEELSQVARALENLEKEDLATDNLYNVLKEKHNNNQVLFYTYYKDYRKTCMNSSDIILFFFDSSNQNLSNKQGMELDLVANKIEDIYILPMDYGFSQSLDYFYSYYESFELPVLVVNYNQTFTKVTSSEQILNLLLI